MKSGGNGLSRLSSRTAITPGPRARDQQAVLSNDVGRLRSIASRAKARRSRSACRELCNSPRKPFLLIRRRLISARPRVLSAIEVIESSGPERCLHDGQIVESLANVRVVGTERLLPDRQGALVQTANTTPPMSNPTVLGFAVCARLPLFRGPRSAHLSISS